MICNWDNRSSGLSKVLLIWMRMRGMCNYFALCVIDATCGVINFGNGCFKVNLGFLRQFKLDVKLWSNKISKTWPWAEEVCAAAATSFFFIRLSDSASLLPPPFSKQLLNYAPPLPPAFFKRSLSYVAPLPPVYFKRLPDYAPPLPPAFFERSLNSVAQLPPAFLSDL